MYLLASSSRTFSILLSVQPNALFIKDGWKLSYPYCFFIGACCEFIFIF
ncbi:hypothetical protein MCHI_002715 [Candidatus Magnetoovum chiemensis]|nr:hypothetical protein MCHI_002715 [Candidatus Magnetoovum chiemensis]